MARPKTVDREHVLDAAERIVTQRGAGALSIGAVAEAAGISKGGVQSTFGTREGLIAAMLDRWLATDQRAYTALLGNDNSPRSKLLAHLETTRQGDEIGLHKTAGLLAALMDSPEHLAEVRKWYGTRVPASNATSEQERKERLAFLAIEGAFFLRFFGLVEMDQDVWEATFQDIRAAF